MREEERWGTMPWWGADSGNGVWCLFLPCPAWGMEVVSIASTPNPTGALGPVLEQGTRSGWQQTWFLSQGAEVQLPPQAQWPTSHEPSPLAGQPPVVPSPMHKFMHRVSSYYIRDDNIYLCKKFLKPIICLNFLVTVLVKLKHPYLKDHHFRSS